MGVKTTVTTAEQPLESKQLSEIPRGTLFSFDYAGERMVGLKTSNGVVSLTDPLVEWGWQSTMFSRYRPLPEGTRVIMEVTK